MRCHINKGDCIMIRKPFFIIFLFALIVFICNVSAEVKMSTEKKGPVAVVPSPNFVSKPVVEGNSIVHEYVIKNIGTETLKISRVRTG